jgi:tetratricopeptide (TPR) repeat protein
MPPPPPKQPTSADVSFEVPVIEIKGMLVEPEAHGRPGMPLVDAKRKTTLEKQRALVQSTKDLIAKQAQAAILATMIYRESKKAERDKEKEMLTEARQVLRDVAQQAGDKQIDEITLRLLGSYELLLDDFPAAEKAWQTLIEKDPKSKELSYNKAYLAYAQLKQFKNAEALATLNGEKVDEKEPEVAYVTAWARWRAGDSAGAWQAITTAARGWGENPNRDELERDILVFAARAGVPLDAAVAAITQLVEAKLAQHEQATKTKIPAADRASKAKAFQYELVAKLGLTGYGLSGRWADGVSALEKAVEIAGDTVPPNDRPVIRYEQADFTVRLDAPDAAARYVKQTLDALTACGKPCSDKDKADTVQRLWHIGRLFHALYATANDPRYYEPAHSIYAMVMPALDPASRAQLEKDNKTLETTLRNIKVGTGTHDKGALGALLGYHNTEVEACYASTLQTNPKLGGTITLHLESDATGVIKGASTEPKAGAADLSAVAGCVADHAKAWKLTKRGMAGNTRIKMTYALSLKK